MNSVINDALVVAQTKGIEYGIHYLMGKTDLSYEDANSVLAYNIIRHSQHESVEAALANRHAIGWSE